MKKNNILYLTDRVIYYKGNSIIKYPIKEGIIINTKVANNSKFNKVFKEFISSNKLNNSLLGDKITILINATWTKVDMDVIKNILINFNYRRVDFLYDYKYFRLDSKNAYLNITDNNILLYIIDDYKSIKTVLINSDLFDNLLDKMEYIARRIENKELYILGSGEDLNCFFNNFEDKYNINTYIFSNHETYLLDSAK